MPNELNPVESAVFTAIEPSDAKFLRQIAGFLVSRGFTEGAAKLRAIADAYGSSGLTDDQIKHMVDRFLAWRLPEDFQPDGGISFERDYNVNTPHPMKHEPIGTNLFTAAQAEMMIRHLVEGIPGEAPVPGRDYDELWQERTRLRLALFTMAYALDRKGAWTPAAAESFRRALAPLGSDE